MNRKYRLAALLILLVFCGIVIQLRRPYISDEISPSNTAHAFMLTTLIVWQEQGVFYHHAAAIQTWPLNADLRMHYYERLQDKIGHNYYISHPPFAFQLAAVVFTIFCEVPNQMGLQYILLFLLLSGAILIAWIVKRELDHDDTTASLIGIAAAIVYLFIPVNLYAYTFHYFAETLGQFFFIASLSALVYFRHSDRPLLAQLILGISVFLLSYTDWMGIPFVICLWFVYRYHRKEACYRRMILISLIASVSAYLLVFIQYLSISGFTNLYRALGIRFLERSGYFGPKYTDMQLDISNTESWRLLALQIHELLIGPGYLVLLAAVIGIVFSQRKRVFNIFEWPVVMILALIIPLIYSLILFSATATHYIYMAKFTPFISILAALAFQRIGHFIHKRTISIPLIFFLVSLSAIPAFMSFKRHVRPPEANDIFLNELVQYISKTASSNEAIFIKPIAGVPESAIIYISFASERSICYADNEEEATILAEKNNQPNFTFVDASSKNPEKFSFYRANLMHDNP